MIFDTHAHYYDKAFDKDRDTLLPRLHEQCGVCGIVNAAEHLDAAEQCLALAERYDFCWAAAGVHPNCAQRWRKGDEDALRVMLSHPKAVALGEIGLDYHRGGEDRALQREVFVTQLEMAKQMRKPVILHDREAHGDMYPLLRQYRPAGVLHCFSGGVELAREALDDGLYIGLGGAVTFRGAVKPVEVARYVPLDRLVLETDAPWLIPAPCRRKEKGWERCDSSMIAAVAACIAALRGMDTEELLAVTERNARQLYSLPV